MAAGIALVVVGAVLVGLGSTTPAPPSVAPPSRTVRSAPPSVASVAGSPSPAATRDPLAPIPLGYRIQIPRLSIDLPIAEGDLARDVDQGRTPEGFAFHLPGSSIPGVGGNTYLYAHARVGMFLALWDARPGDQVLVSTPDLRVLRYVIADIRPRVPPDDISVVQPTLDERLTLQTSTGPTPADPRFIAIAIPATPP